MKCDTVTRQHNNNNIALDISTLLKDRVTKIYAFY